LLAKLYYNEREFTRLSTSRSSAEEELSAMVNEQQKVTDEISKTKTDYHILEKNLNEAEEMLCRMV
jgi:predicted  nucleic acid-binding Zn-ribbon protein